MLFFREFFCYKLDIFICNCVQYFSIQYYGGKKLKGIIGAIAGDIIVSTREFNPIKTTKFSLFDKHSKFTDDTIMTLAVAKWLINDKDSKEELVKQMQVFGNKYLNGGYGRMYSNWLQTEDPQLMEVGETTQL